MRKKVFKMHFAVWSRNEKSLYKSSAIRSAKCINRKGLEKKEKFLSNFADGSELNDLRKIELINFSFSFEQKNHAEDIIFC